MGIPSSKIDALGRREAAAVAAGATQRVFASFGTSDPPRRQAVCLKLQEIAIRNRDDALLQKAEELATLAYKTYELRTQGLAGALTDEQALTRRPASPGSDSGLAARRER